ncbi:MAG: hypothetical protein WDA16_02160 [Candidatus Thermoplasmatota archaeon]
MPTIDETKKKASDNWDKTKGKVDEKVNEIRGGTQRGPQDRTPQSKGEIEKRPGEEKRPGGEEKRVGDTEEEDASDM